MALHCPDSIAPMAGFFNGLSLEKLDHLADIYAPAVEFQDPLQQTRGLADLRKVYQHLFQQNVDLAVTVTDAHGDDRTGFLLWTMRYHFRGKDRVITGTSHLQFAPDGRVAVQRDHWDASFPVYGEFPLLGWVMRAIQRRAAIKPEQR